MTKYINQYPEDCVLLEWSEQQQAFFVNDVIKGKLRHPLNHIDFPIVHVCRDSNEAFLIGQYVEKFVIMKNSPKNKRVITTASLIRQIKALIKFSSTYSKIKK